MKLRNKSAETVKRAVSGGWQVVKPGDTIDIERREAEYLLVAESHLWEAVKPKPETPAKGGE